MHRLATCIVVGRKDGQLCSALVPTTASVLRFADERLLPGVLPGGCEWEIKNGMFYVRSSSYDPEKDVHKAVDYLWSFRRKFGRRRRLTYSIHNEIAAHRRAFVERFGS